MTRKHKNSSTLHDYSATDVNNLISASFYCGRLIKMEN